ncbi:MAG: hypothetical protein II814_08035 [Treponema sp.]|nr:hypothetical protein [Treponema sp.]
MPPFVKAPRQIMTSVVYNAGIKENAGIFNHTQGWGVIAETLMGNGDQAFEYSKASIPPAYNDKAEIRQSEPYVVGQTTYSTFSPRAGNTRVSWLSGAATWNYYSIPNTFWESDRNTTRFCLTPAFRQNGTALRWNAAGAE